MATSDSQEHPVRIDSNIKRVIESGEYVQGPMLKRFVFYNPISRICAEPAENSKFSLRSSEPIPYNPSVERRQN